MKKIKITFPDNSFIEAENEIRPILFLEKFNAQNKKIVAVKVNNEICSLDSPVNITSSIEPVFSDSKDGSSIYRRSLCFVLAAAAHKIFPGKRLLVGHSLGYGYYYTLELGTPLTKENILKLKNEMEQIIKYDKIIETDFISYSEACSLFEELGLTETRKQLNYRCPSRVQINRLEGFSDLYFGPLVGTTGILNVFDLLPYSDGFLLRFPKKGHPEKLTEFVDQPKLFEIYKSYKLWGKRLNVTSAASLNQLIHDRKESEFIDNRTK